MRFRKLLVTTAILLVCQPIAAKNEYLLLSSGRTVLSDADYDQPQSYQIVSGIRANKNVAIESGYIDMGQARKITGGAMPEETIHSAGTLTFGGIGSLPLARHLSLFFAGGLHTWTRSWENPDTGARDVERGTDSYYGGGVVIRLNKHLGINARHVRYVMNDDVINVTSGGMQLGF